MNPIGDVANWHLILWPARKQHGENPPAHLAMQAADTVYGAAAAHREIRHVERLGIVVGIFSAEGHHLSERNAQFMLGVFPEPVSQQPRFKPIKTRRHGRVSSEQVARTRSRQRHRKGLMIVFHVTSRALQHGERRMPFIQMAHFRMDTQAPAASAIRQSPTRAPAAAAVPGRLHRVRS